MPSGQTPTDVRDKFLAMDDATLLRHVEIQHKRGSGAGGQKRNKTSSAVRLVCRDLGISAECSDSRSQNDNRDKAILRLRMALAVKLRAEPVPSLSIAKDHLSDKHYPTRNQRKSLRYFQVVAQVLDGLQEHGARLSDIASALGVSTSRLSSFVTSNNDVLTAANHIRAQAGLGALRAR